MRKILVVVVTFLVACSVSIRVAHAQASTGQPTSTPPSVSPPQASEENLKKIIEAAQEARDNQETEDEITQWRTAFIMATQLHVIEGIYVCSLGLEQAFKDGNHPLERLAALRSGVTELKRQSGAGPIWGAQLEVALAIALEEQGKRAEAAASAKRAVTVLESALGSKSHDYRETLHTLATLFEEAGNSVALEFTRRIDEIERARDSEPVFGFKTDSAIRAQTDQLRTAIESSSTVQIELTLMQISGSAEKLDVKNPFRAKGLSESAMAVLKAAEAGKKTEGADRVLPLAESMLRKALDAREKAMGANTLADTSKLSLELYHLREYQSEVDALSVYYASIGEAKKQEELLVRALGASERILGKNHPALAGPLRRLGDLYFGAGNKDRFKQTASEGAPAADDGGLDKAIGLIRREVAIYENAFGSDDPILHASVARLGELLWMKGDEKAAKACDERAGKLQEADSDSKTPEQTMLQEVKEHRAFLRFEEAEDQFETFHKMHPDKS
jgi:hypothetical protein